MKGALSARRRKETASKSSGQGKRRQSNGSHRSELAGGLSEASFVLSEVEAKVNLLTRQRSLGAPARLTESRESIPDAPTPQPHSPRSSSPSPTDSPQLRPLARNRNILDEAGGGNANILHLATRTTPAFQKWEHFASSLLKRGYWSRLGDLARTLNTLPDDIITIFSNLEEKHQMKIDEATKLKYYKDFTRVALGATMLHIDEVSSARAPLSPVPNSVPIPPIALCGSPAAAQVESLLLRLGLGSHMSQPELRTLLSGRLEDASSDPAHSQASRPAAPPPSPRPALAPPTAGAILPRPSAGRGHPSPAGPAWGARGCTRRGHGGKP